MNMSDNRFYKWVDNHMFLTAVIAVVLILIMTFIILPPPILALCRLLEPAILYWDKLWL